MCEVNGPRLLAWMDGEMEGREGEEIAAHVRDCAECNASLARFRAVSAEVADYRDQIARGRGPSRRREWIRVAAIAAVVLLAIMISRAAGGIQRRNSGAPYAAGSAREAPVTVIRVV